jgi:CRISPR-associated endonuclease/helicase Cas3
MDGDDRHLGFPAITTATSHGVEQNEIGTAPRSEKSFEVELLNDVESARNRLVETASKGGCSCLVKNTVGTAREAAATLCESTPTSVDVTLFHSRFTAGDRRQVETDIIDKFGPQSDAAQRSRRILVGTQVVEQSLDIDFDQMVSDLAPIDLLLQRAGRMQRHDRSMRGDPVDGDDRRGPAILGVVSPEVSPDAEPGWYGGMFPDAQYVYANDAILWLTARRFVEEPEVRIPADLRAIIEHVYGEAGREERLPDGLHEVLGEARRRRSQDASLGRVESLDLSSGYHPRAGKWQSESTTRLGLDSVTLRLARCTVDGEIEPWNADAKFPWAMSEVDVPSWKVSAVEHGGDVTSERVRELERQQMPDRGRYARTVVLSRDGDRWSATAKAGDETKMLIYNSSSGLQFV